MLNDQEYILDQIVRIVEKERPDVVLISGDVYNTSTPSAEAVHLLDRFITNLNAVCNHIFILPGNHDSAERLAFGSEIMSKNGVYFSQTFSANPQKITLNDSNGEVNIYLLPFVRPIDVRYAFKDDSDLPAITTYDDAIRKSIEAMQPDYTQRNILIAHQYIKNGNRCDGEESIGGLDEVDADIVKDFDYVALGHLHRPQQVQYPHIRYSGSPLPMGFGEVGQQKKVCLVECEGRNVSVRQLNVPLFQKLEKLSGDLPALEARLAELSLAGEPVWTEVLYTGPGLVSDLRERLLEKAASHVEILRVRCACNPIGTASSADDDINLEDMDIFDVFERRLDDLEREAGLDDEQRKALRETYAEAVREYNQRIEGE